VLVDDFLSASAERHPQKTALVCGDRRATFAELDQGANALAHALQGLGLERQARVCLFLDNSFEAVQGMFAALRAGGIFSVINPQVKPDKLGFILRDSAAHVLLTTRKYLAVAASELAQCPALRFVVVCDAEQPGGGNQGFAACTVYDLQTLLAAHPTSPPPNRNIDIDVASLIYTSGTTGSPKGVALTHANIVSSSAALISLLQNTESDIVLSALPLAFNYGLYQALMVARFGGTLVLERQFAYPYKYIELIKTERATGLPIVPTMTALLMNLKDLADHDLSSVRYVTNTAQALPEHHIRKMRDVMPQTKIFSMYGLTECKRVTCLRPELIDRKPTSVGKAVPNTEAWLEDEQGRRIDTPNVTGELIVRGSNVMSGYWNRPDETAKCVRAGKLPHERELKTGDLFRFDSEGDFYFVARKDDLIKTAGERVGPREIENVLYELTAVREAAVIGVPDDILGQAIKAFIVLRDGEALTVADVVKHCQKRLEKFMAPKFIEFRSDLPKTSTGKISKQGLQ
jgi:long-chain acyl-CoA synthetase